MSVRRIAARAATKARSLDEQHRSNRTGRFAVLILGAGGVSGVAAMLGIWPFGSLQVFVSQIVHGPPSGPIEARSIFPPVPPVHQVIDVYDPPPPAAPAPPAPAPAPKPSPQPPQATPTPRHHPSPTPPITSSPSPSPSPGGGGD
jgi:hypothetical protein